MSSIKDKRFISDQKLSREQALWLCRAIWTHYRSDATAVDQERDTFDVFNRVTTRSNYKRGRDWVLHPVGYDLKEVFYGSERSGFREAWAALMALSIEQKHKAPDEHRTYTAFGLVQDNYLSVAVYRITEVRAKSADDGFLSYVEQCFSRLVDDAKEVPVYDPRGKHNQHRAVS